MKWYTYILWFLVYMIFHFLDALPEAFGFSFAQLWKIPILLFMAVYVMTHHRKRPMFENIAYILALEYMMSPQTFISASDAIVGASKVMLPMLFFGFFSQITLKKSLASLEKWMYVLSDFIALSTIPYLLGILTPYTERSADAFGIEGLTYFSGIFYSAHSAASFFSVAFLVLLFGLTRGKIKGTFNILYHTALVILLLVCEFKAYTRTGWMMTLVGSIMLIDFTKMSFKKAIFTAIAALVGTMGLVYFYTTNEAFEARMNGRNIYVDSKATGSTIDADGSGRLSFWKNSVDIWAEGTPYENIFGVGLEKVMENNYKKTRMYVFSHSQFADALAQHGIIGFLLLVFHYILLGWYIYSHRQRFYFPLAFGLYTATFVFAFFQSEPQVDHAIILAIALVVLNDNGEFNPRKVIKVRRRRLVHPSYPAIEPASDGAELTTTNNTIATTDGTKA